MAGKIAGIAAANTRGAGVCKKRLRTVVSAVTAVTTKAILRGAMSLRAGDVASRFDGKEFVDISPEMDAEKALCPDAEICQSVSDFNLPHSEEGGQVGVMV